MVFTKGAAYVPRGRLYFAKWPPLVLLDERVEGFCPDLDGLCEGLERAAVAAGLGVGSVGELTRRFPHYVPVLLQLLDARFAGPFAGWWEALREDSLPSVAERWEAAERPGYELPVACPASRAFLLSTPPRSLRLLRKCVHLNKKFREHYGAALWDVVADEERGIKAVIKNVKLEWDEGRPRIIVEYDADTPHKSFSFIWGVREGVRSKVWLDYERSAVLAALTGDETLKGKMGSWTLTAKHFFALAKYKGVGWDLLWWYAKVIGE